MPFAAVRVSLTPLEAKSDRTVHFALFVSVTSSEKWLCNIFSIMIVFLIWFAIRDSDQNAIYNFTCHSFAYLLILYIIYIYILYFIYIFSWKIYNVGSWILKISWIIENFARSKPRNKSQTSKLHNSRVHKYCTLMDPRIRPTLLHAKTARLFNDRRKCEHLESSCVRKAHRRAEKKRRTRTGSDIIKPNRRIASANAMMHVQCRP